MKVKEPKKRSLEPKAPTQYEEGQEAFVKGFRRDQNPYAPHSHNFADWDAGWEDKQEGHNAQQ